MARLKRAAKTEPLLLSAATGKGVDDVLSRLLAVIDAERAATAEPVDEVIAAQGWRP